MNGLGALTFTVLKVGNDTAAGRVFDLTVKALASKNKLERTADRLARWFLPVVLGLAAITFLAFLIVSQSGWFRNPELPKPGFYTALRAALYPALSILVVACPCALILATPAAMRAIRKPRTSLGKEGMAKPVQSSMRDETQGRISHPIKKPSIIVRR